MSSSPVMINWLSGGRGLLLEAVFIVIRFQWKGVKGSADGCGRGGVPKALQGSINRTAIIEPGRLVDALGALGLHRLLMLLQRGEDLVILKAAEAAHLDHGHRLVADPGVQGAAGDAQPARELILREQLPKGGVGGRRRQGKRGGGRDDGVHDDDF